MKRMLAAGSIAALASVVFAGTASASPADAACFGQVHKAVNTQGAALAYGNSNNVGQLVQFLGGGQAKNGAATAIFCS